jgi:hypothetical protein
VNLRRVVAAWLPDTAHYPPRAQPPRKIEHDDRVGPGQPHLEPRSVSVDDPTVFVDDSLLYFAERLRRPRVFSDRGAPRDYVAVVDPPQSVQVDDGQPEAGAEMTGEGRLARSNAAEDRDSLRGLHLMSLLRLAGVPPRFRAARFVQNGSPLTSSWMRCGVAFREATRNEPGDPVTRASVPRAR